MKVILTKDVANVGLKNQVKEVANGYAQNFLIARGLAEVATPTKVAQAEKAAVQRAVELEKSVASLKEGLAKLGDNPLVIHANANEKNHLFEAVHATTIAAHIKDVTGVAVDEHAVVIDAPIKELGDYTVRVAVGQEKLPVAVRVEGN